MTGFHKAVDDELGTGVLRVGERTSLDLLGEILGVDELESACCADVGVLPSRSGSRPDGTKLAGAVAAFMSAEAEDSPSSVGSLASSPGSAVSTSAMEPPLPFSHSTANSSGRALSCSLPATPLVDRVPLADDMGLPSMPVLSDTTLTNSRKSCMYGSFWMRSVAIFSAASPQSTSSTALRPPSMANGARCFH